MSDKALAHTALKKMSRNFPQKDISMANKSTWKNAQYLLSIENVQVKVTREYNFVPTRTVKVKKKKSQAIGVDEDVGKLEASQIADMSVKWCNYCEKLFSESSDS